MAFKFSRINEFVALISVNTMSTIWCVYVFLVWSILPLLWKSSENLVAYISSDIIQLVALPLILVGQRLGNREVESRDQQDHDTIMAEFNEIKRLNNMLVEELELLTKLTLSQEEIINEIKKLNMEKNDENNN